MLKHSGADLKPINEDEIERMEKYAGRKFPWAYRQFLSVMGKGAGKFMRGSDVFYDRIDGLKDGANELLEEDGLPHLSDDCFVFWMHQGYQIAFFKFDEGDDPTVYYFFEGSKDFTTENSFTGFLRAQLTISGDI